MRAIPIAVTAFAAVVVLTACDSGGDDTSEASTASPSSAASTACEIGQVSLEVDPASTAPVAGDTGVVPFTISNGGSTCTLEGFPGVTLAAGDVSATVAGEEGAASEKLTLAKDETATFTLTYVRGEAGDAKSLDAKTVKISLPGTTATKEFPWTYGPVVGKTTADDPNVAVSPVQHAGD